MSNHNLLQQLNGGRVYYQSNLFNSRSRAPTQSIRVTEGALGSISAELLHSSSVPNEKAVLGSRWAPIDIPDSPIREEAPYHQHHQTQRPKRAREDQSDAEVYSDASNNMKKAKLMHQPENQIIDRSKNGRELPLLQIDLNSPIYLAALDDDTEFDAKELLFVVSPARAMTIESFDNFFYEGESIEDFVGMKVIRVQEEGADGFCHEISVDDFSGEEDFGVQETSADGCCNEKESTDDFSGEEEDTGALLESLGFGDLEQYFWGQPPECLDNLFNEGEYQ